MGRKPKVRTPTPDEVFQVEVILAARVNEDSEWEYHVKWANYPDSENSWEPQANVAECTRLLTSFWEHVGHDNNDYQPGDQFQASPQWIKSEKKVFAKTVALEIEVKKPKARGRPPKNKDKKTKASSQEKPDRSKSRSKSVLSSAKGKAKAVDSSDSDDDTPLSMSSVSRERNKKETKAAVAINTDDDLPLMHSSKSRPSDAKKGIRFKKRSVSSDSSEDSIQEPSRKRSRADSNNSDVAQVQNPPSSPNSLFSSPVRPKTPQTKLSWKGGPKIKPMDIQQTKTTSGSTLDTKNRIFQNPTSSSDMKKLPPPPRRSSLGTLAFKKKPQPTTSNSGTLVEQEPPKPAKEPLFSDLNKTVDSPSSYHDMQADIPISPADQMPKQQALPIASRVSPPSNPTPTANPANFIDPSTIDDFLEGVLSDPKGRTWDYAAEPPPAPIIEEPIVPRNLIQKAAIPAQKIPKKWKWSGGLFINKAHDDSSKLCNVTISNPTDPLPDGLRLSFFLSDIDSLLIPKFLDVADLNSVLPACGRIQQVAKLTPEDPSDEPALTTLTDFMRQNRQVVVKLLSLDGAEVACLILFPSTARSLWPRLKVPADLQKIGFLLAALLPLKLKPAQCSQTDARVDPNVNPPSTPLNQTSLAIQALGFPEELRLFMPLRAYCVWRDLSDGTQDRPGPETRFLHDIMTSCKAKDVGHKADVRVVFVHVGAMKTLHRLPALAERRRRPEIRFYTYGSHPTVPREDWGVFPIYLIGGVVTFTPKALMNNPVGSVQLMRQISQHPFWDCYILPSAAGMALQSLCEGTDPIAEFEAGRSAFQSLFSLLENGEVSLLNSPPATGMDLGRAWVVSQLRMTSLKATGLMKECLSAFSERYSNRPASQLTNYMDGEIHSDLLRIQAQPCIRKDYRRFVVITTQSPNSMDIMYKAGLEWTTIAQFDFKDDFFGTRPI